MSLVASPPPASTRAEELEEQLDAEIAHVHAELEKLRKERSSLSAAVLSSTKVQEHLKRRQQQQQSPGQSEQSLLKTLATAQDQHNATNIHRLAFGLTAFPFTDPAPENSDQPPLLGVRFDIPTRDGRFNRQPYYIFLKRASRQPHVASTKGASKHATLQIHHHTIPSHIDMDSLAARYLPVPAGRGSDSDSMSFEEGDENAREYSVSDDSGIDVTTTKDGADGIEPQSVHLFTSYVRAALMSFHLRADAVSYLAEVLNVTNGDSEGDYSVQSLTAPDPDARHIRIVWSDGSLGRLKVNDKGLIDRAVVVSAEHNRRLQEAERTLTLNDHGEPVSITDLGYRLKICHERGYWAAQ